MPRQITKERQVEANIAGGKLHHNRLLTSKNSSLIPRKNHARRPDNEPRYIYCCRPVVWACIGNLVLGASGTTSTVVVVAKEADAYLLRDTGADKLCNHADRSGSGAAVWCATLALLGNKAPGDTDFFVLI